MPLRLPSAAPNADRAIPLVVEHVAKSYDVDDRVVPVIGDLSLTLDKGRSSASSVRQVAARRRC